MEHCGTKQICMNRGSNMSVEITTKTIKPLHKNKLTGINCFQSAVSRIWIKYKQNKKITTQKNIAQAMKTYCQEAISLENKNCTTKQIKNKWLKI